MQEINPEGFEFQNRVLSRFLHGLWNQQVLSKPSFLYSVVKLVEVEAESQKQVLCLNAFCSSSQEPVISHILLCYPEYALCLN